MTLYTPGHIQTASWTSPFTNRLLFEAGWGNYFAQVRQYRAAHRRHAQRRDDLGRGTVLERHAVSANSAASRT